MCDEGYKPIDDEMLWGVPPEEQPKPDSERNFFDEGQGVKENDNGRNDRSNRRNN